MIHNMLWLTTIPYKKQYLSKILPTCYCPISVMSIEIKAKS